MSQHEEFIDLFDQEMYQDRDAMQEDPRLLDASSLYEQEPKPKYIVCPTCEGEGKTVHPGVSVWTSQDRAEDPDGFEDMMRGVYDVSCPECKGKRVVTRQDQEEYKERMDAHFERLRESGIYPGNPDYF